MTVTLYLATSIDWFIAKTDGDSDWISEPDFDVFDAQIEKSDCIIVWNSTFQQYEWEIYPIKNKENIVISSKNLTSKYDNVTFFSSPEDAIKKSTDKNILLVWGGHISGSFLRENLIDEIIIDIQPVILWKWIKIFEDVEKFVELEFLSHTPLEQWLNILRYKVKK